MTPLALHDFHAERDGRFTEVNGMEAVGNYGDWRAEHAALRQAAGVIDRGFTFLRRWHG